MSFDWNVALTGQSLFFRLLGKAFYVYPERAWIESLVNEDIFEQAPFASEQSDVAAGLALLQAWSIDNKSMSDEKFDGLRVDYTRLFIGPGTVLTPPWESVYFSEERLTFQESTLQVRAWYRRYGLQADKLHNEPDDHIGLELEFIAHLAGVGFAALEKQDQAAFANSLDAQRGFLSEHLLKWAPDWCSQVQAAAKTDFYRGIAMLSRGALMESAEILEVKVPALAK